MIKNINSALSYFRQIPPLSSDWPFEPLFLDCDWVMILTLILLSECV